MCALNDAGFVAVGQSGNAFECVFESEFGEAIGDALLHAILFFRNFLEGFGHLVVDIVVARVS